jgi:glycine betaine/proline transport system ATP-binding protein
VWENVAYGLMVRGVKKARRRSVAEEMLALVHLDGWGHRFPDELSGGMQQRVGLARALATGPDILLLDEPFSALDPLIRRQLQDEFLTISRTISKTAVFITHDIDEAIRLGHRIAIMKDGRFVQTGIPEDIVLRPSDDYVREFVKGISTLTFVRARSIMRPVGPKEIPYEGLPRLDQDDTLDTIVDLAVKFESDLAVVDADGGVVGTLTHRDILRAVRGGQAEGGA